MGGTQNTFPCYQILILGLMAAGAAQGHPVQVTGVVVNLAASRTSVTVVAHLPLLDGADPATAIPARLRLAVDGREFHAETASVERDLKQDSVTWTGIENRGGNSARIQGPLFPEVPADSTVMLVYKDGKLLDRAVVGESLAATVGRFVKLGIFHILSGPDHILFVLGLIMMGGPPRRLLVVITAFTVAHSITLSMTALGLASLTPRIVEPLIAFSIIVVGLENLFPRRSDFRIRVGLAFGFGFFHGFGFAGALAEAGLPHQALGWSLASFNAGVELGQLFIVAIAWPLLAVAPPRFTKFASAGIALAGAVWFVARVWS
jgi:hydrogenase/urease accessory protein HupE